LQASRLRLPAIDLYDAADPRYVNNESPNWSGPSSGWSSGGNDDPFQTPGGNNNGMRNPTGENDGDYSFSGIQAEIESLLNEVGSAVTNLIEAAAIFLQDLVSPLVLDLDGDGIELSSLTNSTAFFDLDDDGFYEHTGWVSRSEFAIQ
jgi:hypothetical protein